MIPYNKRQDAQIIKIKDYINGKREYVTGEDTSLTLINTANAPLSDIILKGNTSQQQYSGKNLVPITAKSLEREGVTFTINNNQLTINGTATKYTIFFLNNEIWSYSANNPILEAGTYNLSFNNEIKFSDGGMNITIYNENSEIIYEKARIKNNFSFSISEKGSCTIRMEIMKGQVFDNNDLQFQIEQGSTATDYEPYTGGIASPNPDYPQDIKVVTGDNTINIINSNIYNLTKNVTKTDYGFINNTAVPELNIIKLKKGIKYLFSLQLKSKPTTDTTITTYFKNSPTGKSFGRIENYELNKTYTIEYTPPEDNYSFFHIWGNANKDIFEFRLWINVNEAQEFEFYNTQSFPISLGSLELCKIGDYQDYIYKNNGKWYKHKVISKRICYPTGLASKLEGTTKAYLFGSLNDALMSNNFYREKGFCDISYNNMRGQMYGDKDAYGWNIEKDDNVNNNFNIRFDKEKFPNLDTIKNYFKDKGVTFYYILATPTEEEIIDTTLISQLNALYNAYTYNDTTNIFQTNANLPFIINAEAFKKLL